jgi:hypothetical protein
MLKAHARSAASQAAGTGESTEIASDAESEDVAQGNVALPQFQEGYDGTQMREDIGKFGSSFIQAEYLQSALPIIEYDHPGALHLVIPELEDDCSSGSGSSCVLKRALFSSR